MEKKIRFFFKKREKLKKRSDFDRAFKQGKSVGGRTIVLYFPPNQSGFPRAGFIASKKVSRKAVERNRAKRLMREVFRLNKHRLKAFDIVFIAKASIVGVKFQDVERDFLSLAEKAGILQGG